MLNWGPFLQGDVAGDSDMASTSIVALLYGIKGTIYFIPF